MLKSASRRFSRPFSSRNCRNSRSSLKLPVKENLSSPFVHHSCLFEGQRRRCPVVSIIELSKLLCGSRFEFREQSFKLPLQNPKLCTRAFYAPRTRQPFNLSGCLGNCGGPQIC
jgi:hypothetical protein